MSYGAGKVAKPEFKDLVRRADLIVMGKVVEIGPIAHSGPSRKRPKSKQYTYWESSFAVIRIEQTLKGKANGAKVKIAYKSDLEGDFTSYQAGKSYVVFLSNPRKFPDAYTTTAFHYGEYRINDKGRAERVHDASEMSKPLPVLYDNIRKALGKPGTSAS
ncbi:MAG: hypothetical protein L0170_11880 [Acidobacteria bacterium]|nr:hypothetical protein [Acidobacteriota bacterium]